MTDLPLDQEGRRQAAERLDVPICVEAAAGTGKTRLIEDRVVQIVLQGTPFEQVVAITFTEAAAAELRARIRARLASEAVNTADPSVRARFREALGSLDSARVETIHAFAQSLLRERPVEAGVDPGFEVLDPLGMELDLEAAWSEWFGLALEKDSGPVEAALLLGFEFGKVKDLGKTLHRNRDLLPLSLVAVPAVDLDSYRNHLSNCVRELDVLRGSCSDEADEGYVHILAILDYHARIQAAPDDEALQILASDFVIKPLGAQKNWRSADDCRRQKEICGELGKAQQETADVVRSRALRDLLGWLEAFPDWYGERRRRLGKLDFDDLLVLTRNVLRDNKPVRQYFQERFKYLLVDEFQDTDPLQMEIVFFLSERPPARADTWSTVELDGGKLFVVGDPKQSIYRFRRADIAMYDAARKAIERQGLVIEVSQNFRCADAILEWTNEVFREQMDGREGVQPSYIDLVPWPDRQVAVEGPAVSQLAAPKGTAGRIDDVRRREAAAVAALIEHEIVGRWQVEKDGAIRAAEHGDILILVPTRTGLDLFEQTFHDWGLVYRHEGGNFFYRRQEVRDLIAYLSAIDNPSDQRAAVATLRHVYGIADEDLLLHKANGGNLDFRQQQPVAGVRAVELAFADLKRFHERRNDLSLGRLVEDIISAGRMIELNLALAHRRQAVANIYKVAQLARQYETQPSATLHRFVRWLRENRDEGAREADSPFSGSPGKEVQILTMHMAKGLEFPIVILANLGSTFSRSDQEYIDRENHQIHVKRANDFRTPRFDEASQREQERIAAERIRLLYVATTRARDHLVVSAFEKPNDENWLSLLGPHRQSLPALAVQAVADVPGDRQDVPEETEYPVDDLLARRERWLAQRTELLGALPYTKVVTASALIAEHEGGRTQEMAAADIWIGADAARMGSALHAVLEQLSSLDPNPSSLEPLVQTVAREHQLKGRSAELASLAEASLRSLVVSRALKSGRAWREVPFALEWESKVLEGSIDLVFEEEGELVVVDFKSDNVAATEAQTRAAEYRPQASLYALACERLTGCSVREFVFVFARPEVEVTLAGSGLADEARALLVAA